ncbi:MAG: hypothetical protein KJZ69_15475 [Phycisphaerales bacterium]|nr:hypothetical protein [Phycisphaerales bacterium]
MSDPLAELLVRVEYLRDGVLTPQDVRAWPREWLASIETMGILDPHAQAEEIIYDGCDHECAVPNLGFEAHPDDPERLVCVHRCMHGCGVVFFEPHDFEQWQFSLMGLARAVAEASGASGTVVEDVHDRIVLVGTACIGGLTSEVFLGFGLARSDAAVVVAAAERLSAAEHPVVLSVGVQPQDIWSLGIRPRAAVLAEHARLETGRLYLDLASIFPTSNVIEVKPSDWITVTKAAELLIDDISWPTLKVARAMVSRAAGLNKFRTNGKKGIARRIHRESFDGWRLEERNRELAKKDKSAIASAVRTALRRENDRKTAQ